MLHQLVLSQDTSQLARTASAVLSQDLCMCSHPSGVAVKGGKAFKAGTKKIGFKFGKK